MKVLISFLTTQNLQQADLGWLMQANQGAPEWDRDSIEEIMTDWQMGNCALWRLLEPVHGVVLTRTQESFNGDKVLWIVRMAGEHLVANLRGVIENFQALASAWGCTAVRTMIYDSTLAAALERAGCQSEAIQLMVPAKTIEQLNEPEPAIEELEFDREGFLGNDNQAAETVPEPVIEELEPIITPVEEATNGEVENQDENNERASDVGGAGVAADRGKRNRRHRA